MAVIHRLYFDTPTGRTTEHDVDFSGSLSNLISDILSAIGRPTSHTDFHLEYEGCALPSLAHLLTKVEEVDAGLTLMKQVTLVRN